MPTRAWMTLRNKGQYRLGYGLNAAIGQGATTVSVLQLALAYARSPTAGRSTSRRSCARSRRRTGTIVQEFSPRVVAGSTSAREPQARAEGAGRGRERGGRHGVPRAHRGRGSRRQDGHRAGVHKLVARRRGRAVWYFNREHAWFAGYAPTRSRRSRSWCSSSTAAPAASTPPRSRSRSSARTRRSARKPAARCAASARPRAKRGRAPGDRRAMIRKERRRDRRSLRLAAAHRGRADRRARRGQPLQRDQRVLGLALELYISQLYWLARWAAWSAGCSSRSTTGTSSAAATCLHGSASSCWCSCSCSRATCAARRGGSSSARFRFQPSEFMKICLIVALAKYLHDDPKNEGRTLKDLAIPAILTAVPAVLVCASRTSARPRSTSLVFLTIARSPRSAGRACSLVLAGTASRSPSSGTTCCSTTSGTAHRGVPEPRGRPLTAAGTRTTRGSRSATAGCSATGFMQGHAEPVPLHPRPVLGLPVPGLRRGVGLRRGRSCSRALRVPRAVGPAHRVAGARSLRRHSVRGRERR
jgi:hypothetical protein